MAVSAFPLSLISNPHIPFSGHVGCLWCRSNNFIFRNRATWKGLLRKTHIGCNRAFSVTLDKTCSDKINPCVHVQCAPRSAMWGICTPSLHSRCCDSSLTARCTCATNPTLLWNRLLCREAALGNPDPGSAREGKNHSWDYWGNETDTPWREKPASGEMRPNKRGESDSRGPSLVKIF